VNLRKDHWHLTIQVHCALVSKSYSLGWCGNDGSDHCLLLYPAGFPRICQGECRLYRSVRTASTSAHTSSMCGARHWFLRQCSWQLSLVAVACPHSLSLACGGLLGVSWRTLWLYSLLSWLAERDAVIVCGTATGAESCISPRGGQGCCWKTRLRAVYRACEYGVRPCAGTLALGLREEPDYAPGWLSRWVTFCGWRRPSRPQRGALIYTFLPELA